MADWHPEDIKAEIRKRGSNVAQLALAAGLTRSTLGACLERRVSARGERIIADFLGLKPHQIWPSRYRPNGERLRFRALSEAERAAA